MKQEAGTLENSLRDLPSYAVEYSQVKGLYIYLHEPSMDFLKLWVFFRGAFGALKKHPGIILRRRAPRAWSATAPARLFISAMDLHQGIIQGLFGGGQRICRRSLIIHDRFDG